MNTETTELSSETDIAIVGLSGRFPGAENVDVFWQNLKNGVESIEQYNEETLRDMGVSEDKISDPDFVACGALLPDQDKFDAAFFGYSPREAEELDPQQRLFLETAWQAMESAGYHGDACDFPIGVYGGCGVNTYLITNLMQSGRFNDLGNISSLQALMNGNNKDAMTMTLAYKLNLKGPAVTIQTACSTSLSAIHMACRSLLNHEADMTLAGGAWLNLLHEGGYVYQPGAILSPDGHCRPFDEQAQGTIIGSGSGVVALKRLEDAIADGDTVYAVIKGSAMNNDGNTKAGYTAPSVDGQAEVIAAAQEMADTPPETISYIEAHGTGTVLGDPIEIAALTRAFRLGTDKNQYCAVGSVKSNVGHLDAAAGVTGLIKTVLSLKNGIIPASLHYKKANSEIDFDNSPFYVANKTMPWTNENGPRRAGVSSFGIGGTNVHVILEEAPKQPNIAPQRNWQILPLSAKTSSALTNQQANLAEWLEKMPAEQWQNAAYTLQVGRKGFNHRSFVVAQNSNQAKGALIADASPLRVQSHSMVDSNRPVVFMFPGQGSQHINMAQSLYGSEAVFKAEFDRCRQGFQPHLDLDIAELIFVDDNQAENAAEQLKQTALTQPVLFAVEYALAKQWQAWGIKPNAMIGHSIGEYVAACLAGVFSFADTLKIVAQRGLLIQAQPSGSMLSVALSEKKLVAYLQSGCELASVNGPENCVISGTDSAISAAEATLTAAGIAVQRLHVSHAFHSSLVAEAGNGLAALIADLPRKTPNIPFISNVTGTWITDQQATDPEYWSAHLTQTVRFHQGLRTLVATQNFVLLEVGPNNVLSQLAGRDPKVKEQASVVTSLPHVRKNTEEAQHVTTTLGRLWLEGVNIDWTSLYTEAPRRIALPTYPFERKRFWVEAQPEAFNTLQNNNLGIVAKPLENWFYMPSFKRCLSSPIENPSLGGTLLFIDDHDISQTLINKLTNDAEFLVCLRLGDAFKQTSENEFIVRATDGEDYQQVLSTVNKTHGSVTQIFHTWSLSVSNTTSFEQTQERGLLSVLTLVQALETIQIGKNVQLSLITKGMLDVSGHDDVLPQQTTLLGACKVIPQEFPNIHCRLIDFGTHFNATWLDWLVTDIAADDDLVLAYRHHNRWQLTYEALAKPVQDKAVYRQKGVYLITGGLGGIGSVVAEHLATTVQAKLVLLGRNSPNEKQQTWLTKLEGLGAEVMFCQADVANKNQIQQIISEALARFGEINGVIHAAGNGATNLISATDRNFVDDMFAAKVSGTQLLLESLANQQLDFIVLCSSLASIAGGLAKGAYAAANAYLDGIAQRYAQQNNFPVIAVNWDSWREVGMAANMEMPDNVGITPTQGLEVMQRILSAPVVPQILISTVDLHTRIQATKGNILVADLAMPIAEPRSEEYARPDISTPYIAPEDELQQGIAEVWTGMLGIKEVGIHDNLFELGGDSLMGVQMLSKVRSLYEVDLPPASFFKEPTVLGLAQLVTTLLIQQLEQEVNTQELA
ncbi:type I polyketide synthase [Colwellia psychrerythraea]|uniref:6-deoxyerythronolide-B synthase n=1 Tax=Colwellia psychrerythraea TaxID=28229 RepID=A0A099L5V5_COLPS|nr:type I polyketide synthase [Colwellia psychrerythraea]KGJ97527.1 6-deoxyerythronolide-B synthase [Colwellia psychrerythraea]